MNPLKQAYLYYRLRTDWLGEGGLPSPHAQERAHRCLRCPKHDKDSPLEEAAKRLIVRATLDLKRKYGWHVDGEDELHLCGLCRCLLETKIFVPLHIARKDTPDWEKFPTNCWLKNDALT